MDKLKFVGAGHKAAVQQIIDFLDSADDRVFLVTGDPGYGKSRVLEEFMDNKLFQGDSRFVERFVVYENRSVETMLMSWMEDVVWETRAFVGTRDGWRRALKALPEIGGLLDALFRDTIKPSTERFLKALQLVSSKLIGFDRLVFVIDPYRSLESHENAAVIENFIAECPPKVKFVIGQRTDDLLAQSPELQRFVGKNEVRIGRLEDTAVEATLAANPHFAGLDEKDRSEFVRKVGGWAQALDSYARDLETATNPVEAKAIISKLPEDLQKEIRKSYKAIRGDCCTAIDTLSLLGMPVDLLTLARLTKIDEQNMLDVFKDPQVEKLVEKSRSDGHADMYQMRHALYAEWVVDEARHNIDLRARYLEIAEFFRRRFDGKRERAQDLIQYVNYLYRSGDKNAFISGSYLASPLLHQWALYESVLDVSDMQLQIRNRKAEGTAFGNIGLVNAARGNNEAALKCQMEGLAIAREIGDRVDEARALVGIADTQLKAGDPQEALSNLEQSLEIFTETSDHEGMVTAMYNIARIAYEGGQFQSATKLLRRTAAICRKNNNHVVESAVLNTMAAILFRLGKDDEALVDFLKSLSICQRTGHVAGEAVTRRNIARIYEKRGMFIEAVEMVEITVTIDRETRHPDLESDSAYLAQLRAKLKQE